MNQPKSKVIIVTRDGEYDQEDRKTFKNAIANAKNSLYHDKKSLKAAMAKMLWKEAKNKYKDDEVDALKSIILNITKDELDTAIDLDNSETLIQRDMSLPYASFDSEDGNFEVILVLYPNLLIGSDQKIPNLAEFIKAIIDDCEIEGCDNMLYIHDKQILGEQKDEIIYAKRYEIDLNGERSEYKEFEEYGSFFEFIAVFGHSSYSTSIFQSQILKQKFGVADMALDNLIQAEKNYDSLDKMIKGINEGLKKKE